MRTIDKIYKKLAAFTDDELQTVWDALKFYDPKEKYEDGISMDSWAQMVYSEMDKRGMPHNRMKEEKNYGNEEIIPESFEAELKGPVLQFPKVGTNKWKFDLTIVGIPQDMAEMLYESFESLITTSGGKIDKTRLDNGFRLLEE